MTHFIDTQSTVFGVDNDPIYRHVLRMILLSAGYATELFDRPEPLLSRVSPVSRGCVVTALDLPGFDGLELFRAARDQEIMLPFIFVSGKASVQQAVTAMKLGAVDFLTKPVEPKTLLATVDRALLLDAQTTSERAAAEAARARWRSLSAREQDICRFVVKDWLNKQIALELGVSESAVQRQRANALKKLGVRATFELIRLLERTGEGGGGRQP